MCVPVLMPAMIGFTMRAAPSASLVNLAAVADVVEINPSQLHIEFIKHAVIAHAQLEFSTALQSLMREIFQPRAHLINLALHGFTNGKRQVIEGF